EREHRRVTGVDLPVFPGRPELGGRDLRQGRRVALPLRRHADVDVALGARIDADGRALGGAEARALRVAREADADAARAARARLLTAPPRVVVEEPQRALERRREIAGVIGDRDAVLVGEAGSVRHL